MKRLTFTILLFLFIDFFASAQIAMLFIEATSQGISIEKLDSVYLSGIGSDSIETVFKGQEKTYIDAYFSFIHKLSAYLNENNFRWGEQIRCFNRIYFVADGKIEYHIYDFKTYLSDSQKQEFQQLVNEFIVNFKFDLQAEKPFAQCSAVNFRDILSSDFYLLYR